MPANQNISSIILKYLFEISSGKCSLTEEFIKNESNEDLQLIMLGLLTLNEDIEYKSKKLHKSNLEKETLLKEFHHRVKNNLQVITSLLALQSGLIKDKQSKDLFRHSQYRINSMALIHEMLYQSENISRINYEEYIHDLSHSLQNSFHGSNHKVDIQIDAGDVFFNIDTAIPLGLLINEILTNSFKYGLNNKVGVISIKLIKLNPPNFVLEIGDDGTGFSDDINFRTTNSLGLKLIHKLTSQLQGSIKKNYVKQGTNYVINFQEIEQLSFHEN